ncbi:hypothetical protein V8G54_012923 [Vigna mungo]|uniref:Uncharacterized protein n=1 Tax=Vigna mungo TaxID=3915 RepID=A0AAQ3NUR7_VIGMU
MGFVLQGNTYLHQDDIGNLDDEDEDKQMADTLDIAGPFTLDLVLALVGSSYSLESIYKQLFDISVLQASRHEEVYSLLRNLDVRVHVLEELVNPGVDCEVMNSRFHALSF